MNESTEMVSPGAETASPDQDPSFRLREMIGILLHYKWLVLVMTVASAVAAALYAQGLAPNYQARATLVIEPNAPKVLTNVNEVEEMGSGGDNMPYYNTQYKILASHSLISEAVTRLHRTSAPADTAGAPTPDAIELAKSRIVIQPVAGTQLVTIVATHPDPDQAALLANTLSDVYIERNLNQKTEASRTALSWLEIQTQELQGKLRDGEVALNQFKRDNDVLSVSPAEGPSLLATDLGALGSTLSSTRIKRMNLASQVAELENATATPGGEAALVLAPNNEHIKVLLARRKQLQLGLAPIESRYLPDHPKVLEAHAELEKIEGLIAKEIPTTLNVLRRELNTVKRFETELATRLDKVKGTALDLNGKETDYNRISREYETNKTLYSMVLTRSKETNLTRRLETNNVRVLDRARPSRTPTGPSARTNVAMATGAGLALSLVLAFGLSLLDQSVKNQEDIVTRAGLPFLGVIPSLEGDPRPGRRANPLIHDDQALRVHTHPKSLTAETCRAIRSNLLFTSPDAPLRMIAVTSPEHADGKTSTAVKLAVTLAQTQGKTLIVDGDMRRPRLHEVFGVPNETGLSTIISSECTIEDAIKRTEIPGVDVLTSGRIPPNAAELLHSKRFTALLAELRERYTMVIFDTPPVLAVTDAVVLGVQMDGMILVARWRRTSRHALRDAYVQIRELGGRPLGVVLNDLNPKKGAYYYRYRSYSRFRPYAVTKA